MEVALTLLVYCPTDFLFTVFFRKSYFNKEKDKKPSVTPWTLPQATPTTTVLSDKIISFTQPI